MPNLPRVMLRAPLRVVAWMLLVLVGLAAPDVAPLADGVGSHDPPTRTAKERLAGKASDEQRVDNYKVPLDLRGPKPRPAECGDGSSKAAKHSASGTGPRRAASAATPRLVRRCCRCAIIFMT
jgi:hypothetical protein